MLRGEYEVPKEKKCPKCKKTKPCTIEFFYRNPSTKSGFENWCKPCKRDDFKKRQKKRFLKKS
jgi:hypothetical protein